MRRVFNRGRIPRKPTDRLEPDQLHPWTQLSIERAGKALRCCEGCGHYRIFSRTQAFCNSCHQGGRRDSAQPITGGPTE